MHPIRRIVRLFQGHLREWLARRERRSPAAVYEAAIAERLASYDKVREAAAGILYLRRKLEHELEMATREHAAVARQIDLAVDRGDDDAALFLIGRRERLTEDLDRVRDDLAHVTREAEDAKHGIVALQAEIERLREEKGRALLRLANARARIAVRRAVDAAAPVDGEPLDGVRELVEKTLADADQGASSGDTDLDQRLADIRAEQASEAARTELAERKRQRGLRLPLVLPEKTAVHA
jgi:phage shock protein A